MIDPTPLNEQIAHELKEEILSGYLRPNQKISIEELAQRWGVSTTPVRDAVRSLESAGFVVVSPRKSITVASLDLKAFKDVFTLRIALECCAVELAINVIPAEILESALQEQQAALDRFNDTGDYTYLKNVDDDVHKIVLDYCDNRKLVSIMDELDDLIHWARGIVIRQPKSYGEAACEHLQILHDLKSRETQSAIQAMRIHLTNSFERTRSYWSSAAEESDPISQKEMHAS